MKTVALIRDQIVTNIVVVEDDISPEVMQALMRGNDSIVVYKDKDFVTTGGIYDPNLKQFAPPPPKPDPEPCQCNCPCCSQEAQQAADAAPVK